MRMPRCQASPPRKAIHRAPYFPISAQSSQVIRFIASVVRPLEHPVNSVGLLMEASAVEIRLRNHEVRLDANHDSLAKLRDSNSDHETRIRVIDTELRETRDDISEIRKILVDDREERKKEREEGKRESSDTRKALYVTAATLFTFFLSIVGLIATLLNHA